MGIYRKLLEVNLDVYIPIKGCVITSITPLYKLGQHPDTDPISLLILIIYPLFLYSPIYSSCAFVVSPLPIPSSSEI